MHVNTLLHGSDLCIDPAGVEEGLNIALAEDCSESLACSRQTRQTSAHLGDGHSVSETRQILCEERYLANSDKHVGDWTIERFREVVVLSDDCVDEVDLGCQALEEQVAVRGVHICVDICLRKIWLSTL